MEDVHFQCAQCELPCANKRALAKHTKAKHFRNDFHCIQCQFVAFDKITFKRHNRLNHTCGVFKCTECKREFESKQSLNKHQIEQHKFSKVLGDDEARQDLKAEELDVDLDGAHGEAPGGADDGALEHQFGEIEALKLESQLDADNEVKLEIDER